MKKYSIRLIFIYFSHLEHESGNNFCISWGNGASIDTHFLETGWQKAAFTQ